MKRNPMNCTKITTPETSSAIDAFRELVVHKYRCTMY